MRISNRILPDMLVIAFKRGYFCCGFILLYTVTAMMAVFCMNCHNSPADRRIKRASTDHDLGCISFSATNGCMQCQANFLFLIQEGESSCVDKCPDKYFAHRKSEHSQCKDCPENCIRCYSENFCTECVNGFRSTAHGTCIPQTHRETTKPKNQRKGKCFVKINKRWGRCSCTRKNKRIVKRRIISNINSGKLFCRKTTNKTLCLADFSRESTNSIPTCRVLEKKIRITLFKLRQKFVTKNYRPRTWHSKSKGNWPSQRKRYSSRKKHKNSPNT